ncbi:MAG TPA: hypothetical protein VK168_13015 [Saprospiraceae bacterium]|nr:hypothetical protein [Saprospiraceae bacterium]
MPKQLCLFALFFLFTHALYGQSAVVSEPVFIRTDYGYELIGRLRDRVLIFRDRYDDFIVQAFDPQLKLSWTKELEDLDHRGTRILGVVPGRNDFSIIYQTRRRGHTVLRVHKYDPGANLIDSMEVKDYGERIFNTPSLEIAQSDDRNCIVIYNVAERDRIEATCIFLDKMITPWDHMAIVEDLSDIFESREPEITVSNSGIFFWITERNNRKSKLEKHELEVIQFDGNGVHLNTTPLGNYLTVDLKFAFDHHNHQLVGAGLWTEKSRERSNGVFYLRMTPGRDSTAALRYEAFDEKFLSVLRQKDVSDESRGVVDARLQEILLRQDGGVILVAERYREVQRGASAGRGFFRDGMRMIVDYYYDDVFVLAIKPNGYVQWKSALHKKQYSQDDDGIFSSYFLMRTPDRMRFFFNDEIKYENTCSEYVLSASGEFDRNSLLNTLNQSLRLRFRDALQMNANECLVPSEYRGRLKLVLLRF